MIQVKKIEEKTCVFSILLVHYSWGAPFGGNTERLRRRPSVSTGLRWSLVDMAYFIIAHLNSSVARHRISLSSGIRMFARESLTRGDLLNSVVLCRAGSRIPNHN